MGEGTKVVRVDTHLNGLAPRVRKLLPTHMDTDRFLKVASLIVQKAPELLDPNQTDQLSVLRAVLDAARLGLELGREAHLVKFGKICTLLSDYRGLQKLAYETGALRVIEATAVYKDDAFDWEEGTTPFIKHKPAVEADRSDEKVVAFYCIAFFKDGASTFIVRTPAQINHIRSKSRAKDSGPWKSDWQAMGKKTVIRELCDKRLLMLPNADRLSSALEIDNRTDTGEITRPLETDDLDDLRAHVAAETQNRMEELKAKIEAEKAEAAEKKVAEKLLDPGLTDAEIKAMASQQKPEPAKR